MSVLRPDPAEMRRALDVILPARDTVFEARWLGAMTGNYGRTTTLFGYYNDREKYILDACKVRAHGSYVTLQAVRPDVLSRCANRSMVAEKGSGTKDHEVVAYRWLLLDFDPKRPAGISSTDAERELAFGKSMAVVAHLQALGWPDPVQADSGNGAHLLYRIDLAVDDEGKALVNHVLKALAARFSDDLVDLDISVGNRGRIVKMYGTPSCKGDHTPERPHRLSRLTHVPDQTEVVHRELLEQLAGEWVEPTQKPSPKATKSQEKQAPAPNKDSFIDSWIQKYLPDADGPSSWNGGRMWNPATCPWRPEDGKSAFILEHQSGALSAGCQHTTCPGSRSTGNHWSALRKLLEGSEHREESNRAPAAVTTETPLLKHDTSQWGLRPSKQPEYLIEDQVAKGETGLVAGPPNVGKGLYTLQEALCIAGGLGLFGRRGPLTPLATIIVQMEDSAEEMERRTARWYEAQREGPTWTSEQENVVRRNFAILAPNWNSSTPKNLTALLPFILEEVKAFEAKGVKVGMIVIDTFAAVTEGDENAVDGSRDVWPAAYKLRDLTGANVTLIHHVRKSLGGGGKPMPMIERLSPDSLRGSSAITAGARSIRQLEPLKPSEADRLGLDEEKAHSGGYAILALTKVVSGPKGSWILLEQQNTGFWARHPDSDRLCAMLRSKKAVADLSLDEAVLFSISGGCTDRSALGQKHWSEQPLKRQGDLLKAALNRLRNRHRWLESGKSMALTATGRTHLQHLSERRFSTPFEAPD